MASITDDVYQILQSYRHCDRWLVAYSGGLDSSVLLHLLNGLCQHYELPTLLALHINHQLSPNAPSWAQHCQQVCQRLGVELEVHKVQVKLQGSGTEAAARAARYEVFEGVTTAADVLLQAHHLDDQVETFFLRLLRGAGSLGLSGMPASRPLAGGKLLRPLLGFSRAQLAAYAAEHNLAWIEDESNQDTSLDRNYLRLEVLPRLQQRWPAYRDTIKQAAQAMADTETVVETQCQAGLQGLMGEHFGEATLRLEAPSRQHPAELAQWLRVWLRQLQVPSPGRAQLLEFVRQLGAAGDESRVQLHTATHSLRWWRGKVYLGQAGVGPAADMRTTMTVGEALDMPGAGRVELRRVPAGGLSPARVGVLELGLRKGGERCRPVGRSHSQSLKKLLQDHAVPPWWRFRLPLLFAEDGELAAVADLWICAGYQAEAGESGLEIHWQKKSPARDD